MILKLKLNPDGTLTRVPLPSDAIARVGAAPVEDYDEMAVVDLGTATAATLAAAAGLSVSPLPDHDRLLLRDYILDARGGLPTGVTTPAVPATATALYLVAFSSIPKATWVSALAAHGARIITYVPSNAFLVYAKRADLEQLRSAAPEVINVLPFAPAFKVLEASRLYGGDGFARMTAQVVDVPEGGAVIKAVQATALPGTFATFDLRGTIAVSGEVPNDFAQGLALHPEVVSIEPATQLAPSGEREALIVAGALVQQGSAWIPNQAVDYYSWLSQKGLANASDIYLGLLDTGLDIGSTSDVHADFRNTNGGSRITYQGNPAGAPDTSDCMAHGTLVAAVMAGSGGTSSGTVFSESATTGSPCAGCTGSCPTPTSCTSGVFWAGAGVAPAAQIASAKIYDESGQDLPNGSRWAQMPNRVANGIANFLSPSLGVWAANLSSNDQATATGYNLFSRRLDELVRDGSGSGARLPISIVVAAGNAGGLVQAPATAKNIISVGASESYNPFLDTTTCIASALANNAFDVAYFSGHGCADGRVKPDLVAPATRAMGALTRSMPSNCWLTKACGRNPNGSLPGMGGANSETWSWGTSFAAPLVAGAVGLVSKWFKTNFGPLPSPAMAKAMLLNSALDIHGGLYNNTTPIDYVPSVYQGWGKVDFARAFPTATSRFALDQSYLFTQSGGTSWSRTFTVDNPAALVRVTLVWTDAPGADGSTLPLVNDLDLRVYQNDGLFNCWVAPGNTTISESNGQSGFWPCSYSYSLDTLNNVEEVIFPPLINPYQFTVTVSPRSLAAKAIPWGAGTVNQDFALFVTNAR